MTTDFIVPVARIEEVLSHPNADRLDVIKVLGWFTIVAKGEFRVGDLVTYVPIDSMFTLEKAKELNLTYMLNTDQTELRDNGRVRTIKLRQYVSQGLVLPVPKGYKEGDDAKDFYEITKYEPPAPKYQAGVGTGKSKKKSNPYFPVFNKAGNVKFYPYLFQEGELVVITEKIHGTNWRAGMLQYKPVGTWDKFVHWFKKLFGKEKKFEFVYGSHRVQISGNANYKGFYGDDVYGRIAKKYNIKDILPEGYIIYGEVYGAGIQDLTYGLDDIDLVVFDVMYDGEYLDHLDMMKFCDMYGLPTVPVLYVGEYYDGVIQKYTDGKSTICPTQIREGCIINSYYESNDPRVGRKTLKSVSDAYLLRAGATEYH